MINSIYIFETRTLDYLDLYIDKANNMGFQVIVLTNKDLLNSTKFQKFKSIYQHLSVGNSVEFELNCFARYFALAEVVTGNNSFILSDSDIYITNQLTEIGNKENLLNVFVGSEGYLGSESEWQISPHFSIWNKGLLDDFVNYLLSVYENNQKNGFLAEHFEIQKNRLGRTSISDMTLLYMWVKDNKIPFINSNAFNSSLGIDHNISMLEASDSRYKSIFNRKKLDVKNKGLNFIKTSGEKQSMAVVHFQGGYKRILKDFYLENHIKFFFFSIYIFMGRKVRLLVNKLGK